MNELDLTNLFFNKGSKRGWIVSISCADPSPTIFVSAQKKY